MGIRSFAFFLICANQASAFDVTCTSFDPAWTLVISGQTAQYNRLGRRIDFDVVHETVATPGPWPVALTLLARTDTGIAVLFGDETPEKIEFLTQDRDLPVLFSGTCAPTPKPKVTQ